jgi:MFS family permease
MAVGLAGLGMSLVGVGGFPNLIQRLITLFGWRVSYTLLGAGIVVILLPLALIFIRNTPETVGLQPDGLQPDGLQPDGLQPDGLQPDDVQSGEKATPAQESDSTGAALEDNWTRAEALRTVAFWVFSLGSMAIAMLSTGLFFHLISIFADNGFSAETAALVFLPAAISSAIFNVTGGFLSDRIDVRFLLVAALLLETGAMVLAPLLNSVPLIFVYGVLLGGVGGLSGTVGSVVWAKYFGRKHLGSISGLATTILVFGAALGPMPIGIARDLLGSYDVVLWGFALLPLALAFLVLAFGKRPVRQ